MAEVALHEPLVAVMAPEHPEATVPRLDRRRGNDRVDPRRGPPSDEDGQRLRAHATLRSSFAVYIPDRAAPLQVLLTKAGACATPALLGLVTLTVPSRNTIAAAPPLLISPLPIRCSRSRRMP